MDFARAVGAGEELIAGTVRLVDGDPAGFGGIQAEQLLREGKAGVLVGEVRQLRMAVERALIVDGEVLVYQASIGCENDRGFRDGVELLQLVAQNVRGSLERVGVAAAHFRLVAVNGDGDQVGQKADRENQKGNGQKGQARAD